MLSDIDNINSNLPDQNHLIAVKVIKESAEDNLQVSDLINLLHNQALQDLPNVRQRFFIRSKYMSVPLTLNIMMSGLTTVIISWKLESTNTVTATFKDFKVLEGENIMESSKLTFQSLLQNIHNIQ